MSETKFTPAQKRAIREARKNEGEFFSWFAVQNTLMALKRKELAVFHRPRLKWMLTVKGWAVEVGDEDVE